MNGPNHEVPCYRSARAKRAASPSRQVAEDDRWEICMFPLDGIRKKIGSNGAAHLPSCQNGGSFVGL
jgi:hypothetical protein